MPSKNNRDLLEKISRVYAFVRSRSINSTFSGYTFDDFLNIEKDRLNGPKKDRMSKLARLDKLEEDINSISSEAES